MFPMRGRGQAAAADATLYVEDVFSAFTDIGTGASLAQVNGIDLATYGGMTMIKSRSAAAAGVYDTVRGATFDLDTTSAAAQTTQAQGVTAFNSNGFTRGTLAKFNSLAASYVSWTFRKAARFFDVVTYTGNGANRTIAHNLGVVPGMIIIKRTDSTSPWTVYHRSLANTEYAVLNTTAAKVTGATTYWNSTTATATEFSLGTNTDVNTNTATYVAYVFAHDSAGDGIIQCGTFTTNAGGSATITLGWEPQYLLYKTTGTTSNWNIVDTSRQWDLGSQDKALPINVASSESSPDIGEPSARGTTILGLTASQPYIYMTIRKGLMRPPTDATKVFAINARTGTGATATVTAGSLTTGPDIVISKQRSSTATWNWQDRLLGTAAQLTSASTAAVTTDTDRITAFNMDSVSVNKNTVVNGTTATYINYFIKNAKGYSDRVCYRGTGSAKTEDHNLGVVPELMIVKCRNTANDWAVYYGDPTDYLLLNSTAATADDDTYWNDTAPTASVFSVKTNADVNGNTNTYVAYLFATLAGVSKIGTYTGNATTNQIDCGFSAGARFVMIKRIDSTGDWYVWDSTRGIVSGNDPYSLVNSTAAEVTGTDYIDAYSPGFELSSSAPAAINASGGTYLFLAIA